MMEINRPTGFLNHKADYLSAITVWFDGYRYEAPTVQKELLAKLRAELLSTKG